MKTITLFFFSFFFLSVAYSQDYTCEALITLNSQNYEIKKCKYDTLLIWKNKFNDTLVTQIRIIRQDTFEIKRRYIRFGVKNGKIYSEDLPRQYTTISVPDPPKPPRYRYIYIITGKDTIIRQEEIPAQYSSKTQQVVIQEDISPGTPMSILTLDSRVMQKNEPRPTSYNINAVRKPIQQNISTPVSRTVQKNEPRPLSYNTNDVRKPNSAVIAPDVGFESAEFRKEAPKSNINDKPKSSIAKIPKQSTPAKKKVIKKKPSTGTKKKEKKKK
jgi:hypothetical protein